MRLHAFLRATSRLRYPNGGVALRLLHPTRVDYDVPMSSHWRDLEKRLEPGVWGGLLLTVDGPRAPGLTVSLCPPRRLKVSVGDTPLLWTRVWADYYGYELLRASRSEPLRVVPTITFRSSDALVASGGHAPLRRWAAHFAQALSESPHSPLSEGEWSLRPEMHGYDSRMLSVDEIDGILAHEARECVDWDDDIHPLPLREMSPSDCGRVKAWRKRARAGDLPPILLGWISGLAAYVVLDGHDRLLAAKLEGVSAPFLALDRVSEHRKTDEERKVVWDSVGKALEHSANAMIGFRDSRKFTAEKANRILLDAYTPRFESQLTVASSTLVNDAQWRSDVRAEADRQGVDVETLLEEPAM